MGCVAKLSRLNNHKISKIIQEEGIIVLKDFCNKDELEALKVEMYNLHAIKPAFIKTSKNNRGNSFLLNIHPAKVKFSKNGNLLTKEFRKLFNKDSIKKIASNYLGNGWGISNFIYHQASFKEHCKNELFELHHDNFQNCYCLKGFLYLEDCSLKNGAFRYIPRTHKLVRKFFEINKKKKLKLNNNLTSLLDFINQNKLGFKKNQKLINELVEIVNKPEKSLEYVFEGKAGTLILFDTNGIHGGVSVSEGYRKIARFHLIDRKYRFWNHPEQENLIFGIISRILRKLKIFFNKKLN